MKGRCGAKNEKIVPSETLAISGGADERTCM